MSKFIICKPRGGMIDILIIITMCLKHAEKYNRILIIDTRKSLHFKDGFHKYFTHNNKKIYNSDDLNEIITLLKNKTNIDYEKHDPFVHSFDKINLNDNIDKDVILYGDNKNLSRDIIYFFNNFSIKPIILDILKIRLNSLPKNYISIHVRNTDYKSDVDEFINKNQDNFINKPIFLATDDINTITKFKENFLDVHTFTKIDYSGERLYNRKSTLHFIKRNEIDHEIFNIDTVVDFLLLAASSNYYFSCPRSGFSVAAKVLFDEKNTINNIMLSLK